MASGYIPAATITKYSHGMREDAGGIVGIAMLMVFGSWLDLGFGSCTSEQSSRYNVAGMQVESLIGRVIQ